MRIVFRLFGQLRSVLENKTEVVVELDSEKITILEAIEKLVIKHPELNDLLFTGKKIHSFYNIMINNRTIHHEELSTYFIENKQTEISILPFVAGG